MGAALTAFCAASSCSHTIESAVLRRETTVEVREGAYTV
jgi:hypothetical protein